MELYLPLMAEETETASHSSFIGQSAVFVGGGETLSMVRYFIILCYGCGKTGRTITWFRDSP